MRTVPRRTIPEIATGRSNRAKAGRSQPPFCPPDNSQWAIALGNLHNEENTTRGGARFQWPIVATSFHAVDPTVDPNHDADIRIGSEAPKQRVPNLNNGMKAIGVREQPATSDRLWRIVAFKRPSPKLEFSLSPIECVFCCCLCRGPQLEAFGHQTGVHITPERDDQFTRERYNHRLA